MSTTTTDATGTYRIRTVQTGTNFGHYAIVTVNRRRVHETDVYATPRGAAEAADRWIARKA